MVLASTGQAASAASGAFLKAQLYIRRWRVFEGGSAIRCGGRALKVSHTSCSPSACVHLLVAAPVIKLKCFSAGMKRMEASALAGQSVPTETWEVGSNLFPPKLFVQTSTGSN